MISGFLVCGMTGCSTPSRKPGSSHPQKASATQLRDAYVLYKAGKFALAEQKLQAILKSQPDDPAADYLMSLVCDAEQRRQNGQEQPWGYHQTIPQQPIYR